MTTEDMLKAFFPGHQMDPAKPVSFGGTQEPWAPSGPPAQMGGVMNYGPAMQQGAPRTMDPSMLGVTANTGPENKMPEFSDAGLTGADVSGFANYGMTAPALPDPNSGIMALMKMIGQPQQQQAPQAPPEGAIMQYLRSLGV